MSAPVTFRPSALKAPVWLVQFSAGIGDMAGEILMGQFLSLITLGVYRGIAQLKLWAYLVARLWVGPAPLTVASSLGSAGGTLISLGGVILLIALAGLGYRSDLSGRVFCGVIAVFIVLALGALQRILAGRHRLNLISWGALPVSHRTHAEAGWVKYGLALEEMLWQLGALLSLGLLSPVLRCQRWGHVYGAFQLGALEGQSRPRARALWLTYLLGWSLALASVAAAAWLFWKGDGGALWTWYQTGDVPLSYADGVNLSAFNMSGMSGMDPPPDVAAKLALSLSAVGSFTGYVMAAVIGASLALTPYELAWWQEVATSTKLGGASLRFHGRLIDFALQRVVGWILTFVLLGVIGPWLKPLYWRLVSRAVVVVPDSALRHAFGAEKDA